ncbi:host attachment protein [Flocculibacter collagenilyticus]|uniref:host attachment protein n=1 Tax=Flocculibacter collagenilyticus TaxID=2744479 RepID=UPI0018F5FB27|nr:host attachment protein [Flocculibacter collagenilyticus]
MIGEAWLLVANRSNARFFKYENKGSELCEVPGLGNATGRVLDQDLVTDRPGSMSGGGANIPGSDAMEPAESPTERATADFAKELIAILENTRNTSKLLSVDIIAEPTFLGALRKKMSDPLAKLVDKEVAKDVVDASPDKLLNYIKH